MEKKKKKRQMGLSHRGWRATHKKEAGDRKKVEVAQIGTHVPAGPPLLARPLECHPISEPFEGSISRVTQNGAMKKNIQ